MADQGIQTVLVKAVMLIRADPVYGPRFTNCWLPAATWVDVLCKTGHIDASIIIDVRKFNTAMSRAALFGSVMSRNEAGDVSKPPEPIMEKKVLEIAANALAIPSTRSRPSTVDYATVLHESVAGEDDADASEQESPNKRQRVDAVAAGNPAVCSYWPESPEAYQLFKPRRESVSIENTTVDTTTGRTVYLESPQEAVERRIILLQSVHESSEGWRGVVMGGDTENYCTKTEIFEIRQRSIFLCLAYQLALANMNAWTWHDCCKEACKTLNRLGLNQATSFYKTVAEWNMVFRKFESFPHPNAYVQCGKRPLPRLLEIYPDAKDQIVSFGIKNLATLTIESLHDFIVSTVIRRPFLLTIFFGVKCYQIFIS
ncbi:hypothetical protein MHU86_20611 [Fragilaria crotonensis]|nr:hypothetical protein MHU86_20611 [Fragilaria crotonensis]